jgi:hypothetical protein
VIVIIREDEVLPAPLDPIRAVSDPGSKNPETPWRRSMSSFLGIFTVYQTSLNDITTGSKGISCIFISVDLSDINTFVQPPDTIKSSCLFSEVLLFSLIAWKYTLSSASTKGTIIGGGKEGLERTYVSTIAVKNTRKIYSPTTTPKPYHIHISSVGLPREIRKTSPAL